MAGIISRIIGLLYRIPLQKTIGDSGMGYYSAAFQIYSIMLVISSYSLPVAVSKLIAARVAREQYRNAKRLYRCALVFSMITGGLACLIVVFGADTLASDVMSLSRSAIALRILAPALVIVAVMGVMRGFFQGRGTMMPTAASQLLEQLVNAVISVVMAVNMYAYGEKVAALLRNKSFAPAYGAAGGTMGTLIGALAGLIFLVIIFLIHKSSYREAVEMDESEHVESYARIFKVLMLTILPVILSSTIYNISDVLDQGIFGKAMGRRGISEHDIATYWGIFSTKYKTIINVPVALANALCSSMMPSLTASIERGDRRTARKKVRMGMRFVMIVAIPCAVGLAVLGEPILALLFSGDTKAAAMMLRVGSVSVVFYSMSTLSNGVLQGIDRMNVPVRNAAIALVLHGLVLYFTTAVMDLRLIGIVISIIVFSLTICILNWFDIRRHLGYRQEIKRTFIIPLISSIIMGIICYLTYIIAIRFLGSGISCVIAVLVAVVVYVVALLLLKGIREKELLAFPGGRIIAKIARFLHLM